MSNHVKQSDVDLLREDPYKLILANQTLIDDIIYLFIRSGNFKFEEHSEIKQQINEELLKKIPKIQNQFEGKSQFSTYLFTIVRNSCKEIIRQKSRTNNYYPCEMVMHGTTEETLNFLIIEDEMIRLKRALKLYSYQEAKLILCLKLRFRILFNIKDFRAAYSNLSTNDFNKFLRQIYPYENASDFLIFQALTEIFNKYESKGNSPDAIRKWIISKIKELIDLLNGDPPTSQYTEETLLILFEKCFYNEKEIVIKSF